MAPQVHGLDYSVFMDPAEGCDFRKGKAEKSLHSEIGTILGIQKFLLTDSKKIPEFGVKERSGSRGVGGHQRNQILCSVT